MRKKQKNEPAPQSEVAAAHDFETERAVLGSIVLKPDSYYDVAALLHRDDFHLDSHRKIYTALEAMTQKKTPIDTITLVDELRSSNELESIGGVAYVASLLDAVPDRPISNLAQYAEILKELSQRRNLINVCQRGIEMAEDRSEAMTFVLAGMQNDMLRMQGNATRKQGEFVKDFSAETLAEIKELMYIDRDVVGLPFGIPALDDMTTGLRDGEFSILGGFPSSGKTAFALHVIKTNAKAGIPVAMFSVEMRKDQILHRLWSQESEIALRLFRSPKDLHTSDLRFLEEKIIVEVASWPLLIDEYARHINEIVPRAHLYIRKYGAKLIVVDFLQIVDAPGDKEYEKVSYVADALRDLAKETKVPVLGLSQLTRPEKKDKGINFEPNMMMLRSSGKLEQNSHLILFTHRPENDDGPTGEDLIVVGKQRAGVKGKVKVYFDGRIQRWEERGGGSDVPAKQPEQQSLVTGQPLVAGSRTEDDDF
jgi:replicative DNA helicase